MPKDFRSNVRELAAALAEQLADQLVALVRTSSMSDVFGSGAAASPAAKLPTGSAAPKPRGGKRPRRAPVDSGPTLAAITELLAKTAAGLRAEQIREALKLDKPTVTKALTAGLASKKVTKKGERRATKYFAR